jgi:hypothetical protein
MATESANIVLKKDTKAALLKVVRSGDVSNLARIDPNASPWGGAPAPARETTRTILKTNQGDLLRITSLSLVLVAVVCMSMTTVAVAAHAKTHSTLMLNVPFQFTVGDRLLLPGTYSFEQLLDSAPGLNIVAIRSADGGTYQAAVTTTTQAVTVPRISRLVFKRYGNSFFLSQVWTKGKLVGLLLYPSRGEARLVEQQAANEEVSVPALADGAVMSAANHSQSSHGRFEPDAQ